MFFDSDRYDFDSERYKAWLNVVITGLFAIAIVIPSLLWLTWRRNATMNNNHIIASGAA